MQAIQIAVAATAGAGDEVHRADAGLAEFRRRRRDRRRAAGLRAARLRRRALEPRPRPAARARPASATRAIFINSPSNPTGWTATEAELREILGFARERGLWIIADEVYSRFVYDGAERAPSFYDLIDEDDRVIFVNTFSKNWAMTGWRIGWISAPPALGGVIENLIQYSTSGVAAFMQRGAIAALEDGEEFVRMQVARAAAGRSIVCEGLAGSNRVRFAWPDGAFYLFFTIAGVADTGKLGLTLVDEANVGIAPGTAFGAGGEAFMRLCFLRKAEDLERGDAAPSRLARKLMLGLARPGLRTVRRFAITLALSAGGGFLFQSLGMPAGWVSGGLLAVAVASLAGFDSDVPQPIRAPVYLVLGLYSGGGVSQQTLHQMQTWPLSFAILGVSLVGLISELLLVAARPLRLGPQRRASRLAAGRALLRHGGGRGPEGRPEEGRDRAEPAPAHSGRGHPARRASASGIRRRPPRRAAMRSAGLVDILILFAAGLVAALVLERLRVVGGWMLGGLFASSGTASFRRRRGAAAVSRWCCPSSIALAAIDRQPLPPGRSCDLAAHPEAGADRLRPRLLHFLVAAGVVSAAPRRQHRPDAARLRAGRTRCADHPRLSDEHRSGLCRRASRRALPRAGDRGAAPGALARAPDLDFADWRRRP